MPRNRCGVGSVTLSNPDRKDPVSGRVFGLIVTIIAVASVACPTHADCGRETVQPYGDLEPFGRYKGSSGLTQFTTAHCGNLVTAVSDSVMNLRLFFWQVRSDYELKLMGEVQTGMPASVVDVAYIGADHFVTAHQDPGYNAMTLTAWSAAQTGESWTATEIDSSTIPPAYYSPFQIERLGQDRFAIATLDSNYNVQVAVWDLEDNELVNRSSALWPASRKTIVRNFAVATAGDHPDRLAVCVGEHRGGETDFEQPPTGSFPLTILTWGVSPDGRLSFRGPAHSNLGTLVLDCAARDDLLQAATFSGVGYLNVSSWSYHESETPRMRREIEAGSWGWIVKTTIPRDHAAAVTAIQAGDLDLIVQTWGSYFACGMWLGGTFLEVPSYISGFPFIECGVVVSSELDRTSRGLIRAVDVHSLDSAIVTTVRDSEDRLALLSWKLESNGELSWKDRAAAPGTLAPEVPPQWTLASAAISVPPTPEPEPSQPAENECGPRGWNFETDMRDDFISCCLGSNPNDDLCQPTSVSRDDAYWGLLDPEQENWGVCDLSQPDGDPRLGICHPDNSDTLPSACVRRQSYMCNDDYDRVCAEKDIEIYRGNRSGNEIDDPSVHCTCIAGSPCG
ncbi:hypothetical protein N9166_00075 [bacterium]|nr:hypothetical protein [bacterium]MDB4433117.1 hypothetical protein [bacterium]